jgi:hypothetical protein
VPSEAKLKIKKKRSQPGEPKNKVSNHTALGEEGGVISSLYYYFFVWLLSRFVLCVHTIHTAKNTITIKVVVFTAFAFF